MAGWTLLGAGSADLVRGEMDFGLLTKLQTPPAELADLRGKTVPLRIKGRATSSGCAAGAGGGGGRQEGPTLMSAVKRYVVGGAVRDRLLGRPVQDRDWVVVGATPEQMLAEGFKAGRQGFPGVPASPHA